MAKHKFIGNLFLSIIVILVLVSLVNALGLSQDYHSKNPLKVGPGETKEAVFGRFQNPDNASITLKIELIEGGDVAKLIDNNLDSFVIPAGSLDAALNIRVSIPNEIPEGTEYNVVVKYTDTADRGGTGMITMSQSSTSSIPILVEKTPVSEKPQVNSSILWTVIIVIIIIAIVAYLLMRRKSSGK